LGVWGFQNFRALIPQILGLEGETRDFGTHWFNGLGKFSLGNTGNP